MSSEVKSCKEPALSGCWPKYREGPAKRGVFRRAYNHSSLNPVVPNDSALSVRAP